MVCVRCTGSKCGKWYDGSKCSSRNKESRREWSFTVPHTNDTLTKEAKNEKYSEVAEFKRYLCSSEDLSYVRLEGNFCEPGSEPHEYLPGYLPMYGPTRKLLKRGSITFDDFINWLEQAYCDVKKEAQDVKKEAQEMKTVHDFVISLVHRDEYRRLSVSSNDGWSIK